jgi:transcriptional regulator with XRE-family HTH domain
MMKTRLFEWAKEQRLTLEELSEKTGYSTRHLYRIREGEWPVTEAFMARVVLRLGEWSRSLFLEPVSDETDDTSEHGDNGHTREAAS